jgi:hypothetical protein
MIMDILQVKSTKDFSKISNILMFKDKYVLFIYDKSTVGERLFEKYRNYLLNNVEDGFYQIEIDLVKENNEKNINFLKMIKDFLDIEIKELLVLIIKDTDTVNVVEGVKEI